VLRNIQKSTTEAELAKRNAELIDVRQQLECAQATVDQESKWCQTDVDELAELREELRKTVEELDVKQNEDRLLREQLQSQLAEINALHDKVFLRSNATLADLLQPSLPLKLASQMHPRTNFVMHTATFHHFCYNWCCVSNGLFTNCGEM